MRILVACEYSGTVRDAFIKAGHDAMSCDLLPTESPGPDQLREGLTFIKSAGVEVPATIDDHEERYRVWDEYFTSENAIHGYQMKAAA